MESEQKKADARKSEQNTQKGKKGAAVLSGQETTPNPSGEKNKEHKNSPEWNVVYVTVWLTGFTLGLMFYTAMLWGEASHTAKKQLRAYVTVTSGTIDDWRQPDTDKPMSRLIIKNCGQTPAHNLEVYSYMDVFEALNPAPDRFIDLKAKFKDVPKSKMVLGPGTKRDKEQEWVINPINHTTREILLKNRDKGGHAIYVYGFIEYVDAFGKPQKTDFRLFSSGMTWERRGNKLIHCNEGNEAT